MEGMHEKIFISRCIAYYCWPGSFFEDFAVIFERRSEKTGKSVKIKATYGISKLEGFKFLNQWKCGCRP